MMGSTIRRSRLQCLQTVASSLIVSAQNGHSIAITPAANGTGVRAWSPAAPGPARARRAAYRAFAGAPSVRRAAPAELRCHGCNLRRPEPVHPSLSGRTDIASGRNLEQDAGGGNAAFRVLDIDPHQVITCRQQCVRHVDAARLSERLHARRQVDIRLLEVDDLQSLEVDSRSSQRLELDLKMDRRRLCAAF